MPTECFWIEATGRACLTLAVTCVGCGHRMEQIEGEFPFNKATGESEHPSWDDLNWPTRCEGCGRTLDFDLAHEGHDDRHTRGATFYRDAQGRELPLNEFGPGAMWEAPWYGSDWQGEDGRTIVVRVPGNANVPHASDWLIDSQATNCTRKEDKTHHCWCRHGEPPVLTVNKNDCHTCQTGGGSYWHASSQGGWHGHLTNGWLVEVGEAAPAAPPPAPEPVNAAMVGRRLGDMTWPDTLPEGVQDRDFWYVHGGPYDDQQHNRKGHWYICAPGHHVGGIPHHVVAEHEDGLISVLPIPDEANSIQISTTRDGEEVELWHGFIHHGEWRPL